MTTQRFGVPDFVTDMVQLTEYDDIAVALKSPDMVLFRDEYVGEFLGGTLTALNGQTHFERRRIEAPIFSTPALRAWQEDVLRPMLDSYFADVAESADNDGQVRVDLVRASLYLLVRIGASIAGLDDVTTASRAHQLLEYVEQFSTGAGFEWVRLPTEQKTRLFDETLAGTHAFKAEFFDPALERRQDLLKQFRKGDLREEDLPRDILMTMLLHDGAWDDGLLFREVALYLHASIRTTTRAVCHSVEEITNWLRSHPDDSWIVDDAQALRRAVGEVLRVHPLLPALVRRATKDMVMPSGIEISSGSNVALLFAEANHEEKVFGPDAGEFNPFRGDDLPPVVNPYGFAFGGGPHMCMGRRMAAGDGKSGVTGASSDGTVSTIVQAFFRMGVAPDPQHPPQLTQTTFYDDYTTYPVILKELSRT